MTKLSELRGLLRPDQVAQEPTVEDLLRAWKLNRWPGGLPALPDWGDVETAFRAGLFQGDAYAHFSAASGSQDGTICQPDGLMFDAFGQPRTLWKRLTVDGTNCICQPGGDLTDMIGDMSPDKYTVADVYLSEREVNDLPEFDGF